MPPPPKRPRLMSIEDVSSTIASTTSKVPVKEVTTDVSNSNRPESRLSNKEEQLSTDDQLEEPGKDIDLDKDKDVHEVVSKYVLMN